tara:strand:- start:61 stop:705 length:645 start_codon:yes stop_codon:yes gene_type:complete
MEVIFACTKTGGIGKNGKIPWKIKEDMKLFRKITTNTDGGEQKKNIVIMGRTTWESIPEKFRPLPNRINIILSTTMNKIETEQIYNSDLSGLIENFVSESLSPTTSTKLSNFTKNTPVYVAHSIKELDALLYKLKHKTYKNKIHKIFIIGGAKLYNTMFELNRVSVIHVSLLNDEYDCDTTIDLSILDNFFIDIDAITKYKKFTYFKYKSTVYT